MGKKSKVLCWWEYIYIYTHILIWFLNPLIIIINFSRIYYILNILSFLPILLFPPPFFFHSSTTSSFISFQKRAGLPGTSTNHGISCCSKTRHLPLILRLDKTAQWEERGPKSRQESLRQSLLSLLGVPQEDQAIQPELYTEGLGQTYAGSWLLIQSLWAPVGPD